MSRMNCREEEGGFIIDIDDTPIFTCSRGSRSLDMAPGLTLPQAKSALFALGAKLLRVDERSAPAPGMARPMKLEAQAVPNGVHWSRLHIHEHGEFLFTKDVRKLVAEEIAFRINAFESHPGKGGEAHG